MSEQQSTNRSCYDEPSSFANLNEVVDPSPVQIPTEGGLYRLQTLERSRSRGQDLESPLRVQRQDQDQGQTEEAAYNIPDSYAGLNEVLGPSPVQNPTEADVYRVASLERTRSEEEQYERDEKKRRASRREEALRAGVAPSRQFLDLIRDPQIVARLMTELYTVSYLVLFSIFGTLARLGLQAITFYPGAPVVFGVLWANFAGSLVMGFLSEDRMLFRHVCRRPVSGSSLKRDEENASAVMGDSFDLGAANKAHLAAKKTTPLYIGLATGFCGSFTSFSSFIRDAFMALSNQLPTPINHPNPSVNGDTVHTTVSRNGGYSFMALLAVLILTITLSISALIAGGHLAIAVESYTPHLSPGFTRKILDRLAVPLAFGCWLASIFLSIFPPDRNTSGPEIWRGRAVYALVFSPLGCLTRFYVSLWLNGKIASFPLGTFAVNVFGTAVLGMSWDLQHAPLGGVIGCQVLQGIMDGYCGCLTTVSTWVSELVSLRRNHAYRYGAASVLVALASLVIIMGSLQWTRGFASIECHT